MKMPGTSPTSRIWRRVRHLVKLPNKRLRKLNAQSRLGSKQPTQRGNQFLRRDIDQRFTKSPDVLFPSPTPLPHPLQGRAASAADGGCAGDRRGGGWAS